MNKELIEVIEYFNAGSTAKRHSKNINYNNKLNTNCDENISIGTILTVFINEYLCFKEEYDKLPKLNEYKELSFISFGEYNKLKTISLEFYDDKIMESRNGYLLLSLEENNGEYSSYIYNGLIGDKFKMIDVNIDSQVIKQYIDLFKKYKYLMDAYNYFLKKGMIFGNGYNVLLINIDGEILDKLNSFEISFGTDVKNKELYAELNVEISNKSNLIDKKIKVLNKEIEPTSENIEYILKNTYLNNDYLPKIYSIGEEIKNNSKEKQKILK